MGTNRSPPRTKKTLRTRLLWLVLIRRICYCTTLLSGIFTDRTVQATQSFLSTNEQIEIVILQGAIMHTEYIWRYLDIEKFSMLLEQNALFFAQQKILKIHSKVNLLGDILAIKNSLRHRKNYALLMVPAWT